MKLVDFAHLDGLSEHDRINALSLIADGIDLNDHRAFGIALGDKLYTIRREHGDLGVEFGGLLALELGAIDHTLVPLPQDPLVWDVALKEFDAYTQLSGQPRPGCHALLELRSLRQSAGDTAMAVMITRTGLALLAQEPAGWTLSHALLATIGRGVALANLSTDLIDVDPEGYTSAQIDTLLAKRDRDLGLEPSDYLELGTAFYLALLCLERARTLARHPINPVATAEAIENLVVAR